MPTLAAKRAVAVWRRWRCLGGTPAPMSDRLNETNAVAGGALVPPPPVSFVESSSVVLLGDARLHKAEELRVLARRCDPLLVIDLAVDC